MKKVIVFGAGGFIGGHLTKRLQEEGCYIIGVDLKEHEFNNCHANKFIKGDLRNPDFVESVIENDVDELYQLAADMGGAGYVFTGDNDADILHNSALININTCFYAHKKNVKKIFYSSSACIYPEHNQLDENNPNCAEDTAYPANPDSEYGWEKLFSERLYLSYMKNKGLNIKIARFHNIFGPMGTYKGGKEKAPAALCRKVIEASEKGTIDVWGDGKQTRSFLYIDECIEAIMRMMSSNVIGPINIGSNEMISINDLAKMIIYISGKEIDIQNINGPQGVRGRCSDNRLIYEKLQWKPSMKLYDGIQKIYTWLSSEILS